MHITRDFVSSVLERLTTTRNFLHVVVGPRQVGKTTGVRQILDKWPGPQLYITADDLISPNPDWLDMNWKRARSLGDNTLFVVDEVQKVAHWDQVVKRNFDEERRRNKLNIILLGSASLAIQRGLSDSLAGRFELHRVSHWSFRECKKAFAFTLSDYLKFGGYPALAEVRTEPRVFQRMIRDSIIEPVLGRDILSLATIAKPALFRQTFELAMRYPAQELSLQKMLGQLQDRGNVTTIKHYLELLEGAFLVKILYKFATSSVRARSSSPKILPLNTALVHAFTQPEELDSDPEWRGRLVEAAVGAHLMGDNELYYWRSGTDEVDFVFPHRKSILGIEVKSGRRRLGKGLAKFCKSYDKAIPIIIDSDNLEEFLLSPNGQEYILAKYAK